MSAGLGIGLGLVILSLVLIIPVFVVVWWRRLPHNSSVAPETPFSFVPPDSTHTNEAILIVQAGGRVEYINNLAREWFGLHPEEPTDLERLVRRARPAEELLNLFTVQGQKRLSISGKLSGSWSLSIDACHHAQCGT
jgi:PAS domain-containing protein